MDPDRQLAPEDLPPISQPFSGEDLCEAVNILHKMAVKMRERRQENGALRLDQLKLSFTLDEQNQVTILKYFC